MIRFTATECGSRVDDGVLVCGASNSQARGVEWHTFIFMRSTRLDDPDDDGPYFELDDQAWGSHNWVKSVRFAGDTVTITLAPGPDQLIGHRVIEAVLACPAADVRRFKSAVRRVFRDQPERVTDD